MKPGKNDIKTNLLIQGDELDAMQDIGYVFTECFGLDTRIANYKGKKPLGLYQWDYECLIAGLDYIVNNEKGREGQSQNDLDLLSNLLERINRVYKKAYDSAG
ncbi:MAG: hypothetical protein Q3M24_09265 [Candidatus Electrothrix aestuarii]|uniref:Uncharacterized protein n=1 Tax=Candidatus Electrothrix aestuarii TaxID=3062594 RepID=A0AAU8M0Z0_9BACT|nr:hypothetical protein [Candidatus Electrothrix aestuarii]